MPARAGAAITRLEKTMTSIFLRIYGGLLLTLVVVILLSLFIFATVNDIRLAQLQNRVAAGTIGLIAQQLKSAPQQEEALLEKAAEIFEARLEVVPQTELPFTPADLTALQEDGIRILSGQESGIQVYAWMSSERVLAVSVDALSEQFSYGTLTWVRQYLQAMAPAVRQQEVARLAADFFKYPLHLLSEGDAGISAGQRQRMANGGIITRVNLASSRLTLQIQLDEAGDVLQVGPVQLYNPYPVGLIFSLVLFFIVSVSLAIYLLVRGLDRRMSRLQSAAMSISQGKLNVRVTGMNSQDSFGRVAFAFNRMAAHIQQLLTLQKEMIQAVSHELRTPVARLRFGMEMAAEASSDAERQRHFAGMDGDIAELDQLIDEILTYARMEEGAPQLKIKPVNVLDWLQKVVSEQQYHRDKPGLQVLLHRDGPLDEKNGGEGYGDEAGGNEAGGNEEGGDEGYGYADLDAHYMHRAVQNLVGNACRYAASRVVVSFSSDREGCRIDVDDDGPGIPEDQWQHILSPFIRLDDSRTRASGGYGLGLSIVRRIAYWHKGELQVAHSALGGARFSILWPRRQSS
jgi:two-component system sensor histidine kinase RstB